MTTLPAPSTGHPDVDDLPSVASERTLTAGQTSLRYISWLGVSLACHLGITWSLHNLVGLPAQVAFLVSLVTVSVINFLGLRRYVFRSSGSLLRRQIVRYILMNVVHRVGEYAGFAVLESLFQPPVLLAVPLVLGVSTLIRFFVYHYLVFSEPR